MQETTRQVTMTIGKKLRISADEFWQVETIGNKCRIYITTGPGCGDRLKQARKVRVRRKGER